MNIPGAKDFVAPTPEGRNVFRLCFAKIPIFSKHWTSLFDPDIVGSMLHARCSRATRHRFKIGPSIRRRNSRYSIRKWAPLPQDGIFGMLRHEVANALVVLESS
jgi:hypothetical protein